MPLTSCLAGSKEARVKPSVEVASNDRPCPCRTGVSGLIDMHQFTFTRITMAYPAAMSRLVLERAVASSRVDIPMLPVGADRMEMHAVAIGPTCIAPLARLVPLQEEDVTRLWLAADGVVTTMPSHAHAGFGIDGGATTFTASRLVRVIPIVVQRTTECVVAHRIGARHPHARDVGPLAVVRRPAILARRSVLPVPTDVHIRAHGLDETRDEVTHRWSPGSGSECQAVVPSGQPARVCSPAGTGSCRPARRSGRGRRATATVLHPDGAAGSRRRNYRGSAACARSARVVPAPRARR